MAGLANSSPNSTFLSCDNGKPRKHLSREGTLATSCCSKQPSGHSDARTRGPQCRLEGPRAPSCFRQHLRARRAARCAGLIKRNGETRHPDLRLKLSVLVFRLSDTVLEGEQNFISCRERRIWGWVPEPSAGRGRTWWVLFLHCYGTPPPPPFLPGILG